MKCRDYLFTPKKRRGISSIIGALIFVVLMVSTFTVLGKALETQSDIVSASRAVADTGLKKQIEDFKINAYTDNGSPNALLFVNVENTGQNLVEIHSLIVTETTDINGVYPSTTHEIPADKSFIASGKTSNIVSSPTVIELALPTGAETSKIYSIKVISSHGTIKTDNVLCDQTTCNITGGPGEGSLTSTLFLDGPNGINGKTSTVVMLVQNTSEETITDVKPDFGLGTPGLGPPATITFDNSNNNDGSLCTGTSCNLPITVAAGSDRMIIIASTLEGYGYQIDSVDNTVGAGPGIAFDSSNYMTCNTNPCALPITVAAGSDRMITVVTSEEGNLNPVSSVDITGGTGQGVHVGDRQKGLDEWVQNVEMWRIMESDISDGVNTVTVHFPRAPDFEVGISLMSFSGVAQQAEEVMVTGGADTTTTISTDITTVTDDSLIVSAVGNGQGGGTYTSHGTGQTERHDFAVNSAWQAVTTEIKASAGLDSQSHTYSISANKHAQVIASFAPAGGGGTGQGVLVGKVQVGSDPFKQDVEMWRIMESDISTGVNTVTLNYLATPNGTGITLLSYSGVAQQAEEAENSNTVLNNAVISTDITTVTDDSLIVSVVGAGLDGGTFTSHGPGQTERSDFESTSSRHGVTTEIKASAGLDSQSHTYSIIANRQAQYVAAFAPAPGTGGVFCEDMWTNDDSGQTENIVNPEDIPTCILSPSVVPQIDLGPHESVIFKWDAVVNADIGSTFTFCNSASGDDGTPPLVTSNLSCDVLTMIDPNDCGGCGPNTNSKSIVDNTLHNKPEIFMAIPAPFGDSPDKGMWNVNVVNPTGVAFDVTKVTIVPDTPFSNDDNEVFFDACSITNISPSADWSCPTHNVAMWNDYTTPVTVAPHSSVSFAAWVQPGSVGNADDHVDDILVSATVSTNIGTFKKSEYQSTMRYGTESLNNVYLTNTLTSRTDIQNQKLGITELVPETFKITMADMDNSVSTFVDHLQGGFLIINIPKGWTDVSITSSIDWVPDGAGPGDDRITLHEDGSYQIIAEMSQDLGKSGHEALTLEFVATPPENPAGVSEKLYVMHVFGSGITANNWVIGPSNEIVLQVVTP